ncbi:POK9 protein, partial [Catharus fuscescens]|nr:POK9 protein [Catharus fuscescens]
GSLGIDLAAAVDVTLLASSVQTIPTGITRPIYHEENSALGALLFGRSSSGLAGLIVLPGVIDADYMGEIMTSAFILSPPLTITKGTRVAQLILYQKCPVDNDIFHHVPRREARGFRSTGNMVLSLVQKLQQRPVIQVQLRFKQQQCTVHAMAEAGADVTIIS